jgi:membrane protein
MRHREFAHEVACEIIGTARYRTVPVSAARVNCEHNIEGYHSQFRSRSLMNSVVRKIIRYVFFVVRLVWDSRLSQTAASLSFTTLLSLVPLAAIGFGIAAAFPEFGDIPGKVKTFIASNLLPGTAASTVILTYIDQFSAQASRLTTLGILLLAVTSLLLLDTIGDAFDIIWRGAEVEKHRSLGRSLFVYAAILVLGPVVFGLSVTATSYLAGISMGLTEDVPLISQFVLKFSTEVVTVAGFTLLYFFLPNAKVSGRHALAGGMTAGVLFEIMGRLFAIYITRIPTYTLLYGTFSAVPIFLLWIYFSWLVVLFGAVITATLHTHWRRPD